MEEKFSILLRRLIDHLSLTQEEMGRRLGVSRSMVSLMLRTDKEVLPSMSVRMHFDREWLKAFGEGEENESRWDLSRPDNQGRYGIGEVCLKSEREAAGWTVEDLARRISVSVDDYQRMEAGKENLPRKMATRLSHVLKIPLWKFLHEPPQFFVPAETHAKTVPLLAMAECGPSMARDCLGNVSRNFFVQNISDPNAFAVLVAGDFMNPICAPGDVAVVSPERPVKDGALVLVRLSGTHGLPGGGEVRLKLYQASGDFVTLSNYNLAFPPMTFPRSSFDWIYPVVQLTKTFE